MRAPTPLRPGIKPSDVKVPFEALPMFPPLLPALPRPLQEALGP